jgi:DNA transposition AAA+ family ATPase
MSEETGSALVVKEESALEQSAPGDTIRSSWNFSASKIIEDTQHFGPDIQEMLLALFRWCIDPLHPIRREDAARRLGCSPELIYQLLTGKYRNPDKSPKAPSAEFIRKLKDFLADEIRKHSALSGDFVETPTARKIFNACQFAMESHTPVMLYGTSHIGKTWALQYFRAHNNHGRTLMAEIDAAGGLGDLIDVMGEAAGEGYRGNFKKKRSKIEAATTSNTLWILDEVHLLAHTYRRESFFACIEMIRRLHDKRKCGMVLCWTRLEELEAAKGDELLQIARRGVHVFRLPSMPTKVDVGMILHANGFSGKPVLDSKGNAIPKTVFPEKDMTVTVKKVIEEPYAILRQLAKDNGLKAITERIRYAHKLANKNSGKISWETFVDAHLRIAKNATAEPDWD